MEHVLPLSRHTVAEEACIWPIEAVPAVSREFWRHGLTTAKQTITSASPLKFEKLFVGAENGVTKVTAMVCGLNCVFAL
jgi:hypothetical protein